MSPARRRRRKRNTRTPPSFGEWRAYVPVARRREQAAKRVLALRGAGRKVEPIRVEGRKIARTFWGSAWCDNLESYSDYANRLPRGRTYVRNGSVIDLQIAGGRVIALVSGSSFYHVELRILPLAAGKWKRIRAQCAGQIDSLVELLQGRLSQGVMQVVTGVREGLFPAPNEMTLSCTCPDWATMCKHVAAVLYGVGARLDDAPEMLFELRGVDPAEMVSDAIGQTPIKSKTGRARVLEADDLSSVFGVDIEVDGRGREATRKKTRRKKTAKRKAQARQSTAKKTKKKTAEKSTAEKKTTAKTASAMAKRPRKKRAAAGTAKLSPKTRHSKKPRSRKR